MIHGFDLPDLIERHLMPKLKSFGVSLLAADQTEAVLLGPTYALHLYAGRDEFDLLYIERDAKRGLVEYSLRHFIFARFTPEDWATSGKPTSDAERVRGSLDAYATGLSKRCSDLLRGEKTWLRREGWKVPPPGIFATHALAGHLLS